MAANRPTITQYAKSRTVQANVTAGSILTIAQWALPAFGITVPLPPVGVVAAGFALGNILIRRFFTKKPLEEK